jgi:hypothetical protein
MSAKDDMLKKINKKANRYRDLKNESQGKARPIRLIAKTLEAVEYAKATAKTALEFTMVFDREWGVLQHRMARIDPGVRIEPIWHREDSVESWQDLRITGVKISWSDLYVRANPDTPAEETITIEHIWMEL